MGGVKPSAFDPPVRRSSGRVHAFQASKYASEAHLSQQYNFNLVGSGCTLWPVCITLTEGIALRLLTRDGIAAIWHLQMAAAAVYRTGDPIGAASILEIASAAERE
jgi:hypothetical protein